MRLGVVISLLLCLCVARSVHAADGNEINAFGAVQKGLAGAGAAHALDSAWVMLNPAAMTELDARLDLHFNVLRMDTELEPRGVPLAANNLAGEMEYQTHFFIPSVSMSRPFADGTLGFGVFGAQGNRVDYPEPFSTIAYLGNGARRSEYAVVKFPLTYARALGKGWSIGGGLVPALGRYRTDSLTLRLLEARGNNVWDYEIGGGFVLGVHKIAGRLRLGAAYHSHVWMGSYERYSQDLLTSGFDQPQKVQAGIAWQLSPKVEVLMDYKWIDWTSIPNLGKNSVNGGLGWHDQHIVKAGVNWNVNEQWSIRAGVSHGRNPLQEKSVFVNSLTPGLSETTLAVGASYRLGERHELHASLSHVLPDEMRENGRGDVFSFLGRGTRIGFTEYAADLEYSYKF